MTTNDREHHRGGKSLLDLPGELRNAIYEHFIDLEAHPCFSNATKLLWINRQIRAEFGSLYLSQGNATVVFEDVASFLCAFILPPADLVREEVACKIRVELCQCYMVCNFWELDLTDIVSIMRQFPLLSIEWNLVPPGQSETCDWVHTDLTTLLSGLKDMDDETYEKLSTSHLILYKDQFHGGIQITLESHCTEEDFYGIRDKVWWLEDDCYCITANVKEIAGMYSGSEYDDSESEEDA